MDHLKRIGILIFLLMAPMSIASKSPDREISIDLGELNITGEFRRPLVDIFLSDKTSKQALLRMAEEEMKKFEDKVIHALK